MAQSVVVPPLRRQIPVPTCLPRFAGHRLDRSEQIKPDPQQVTPDDSLITDVSRVLKQQQNVADHEENKLKIGYTIGWSLAEVPDQQGTVYE